MVCIVVYRFSCACVIYVVLYEEDSLKSSLLTHCPASRREGGGIAPNQHHILISPRLYIYLAPYHTISSHTVIILEHQTIQFNDHI